MRSHCVLTLTTGAKATWFSVLVTKFPPAPPRAAQGRTGCNIGRVSRWYRRFTLAPGGAGRSRLH
jgi:hypothetical protein